MKAENSRPVYVFLKDKQPTRLSKGQNRVMDEVGNIKG